MNIHVDCRPTPRTSLKYCSGIFSGIFSVISYVRILLRASMRAMTALELYVFSEQCAHTRQSGGVLLYTAGERQHQTSNTSRANDGSLTIAVFLTSRCDLCSMYRTKTRCYVGRLWAPG